MNVEQQFAAPAVDDVPEWETTGAVPETPVRKDLQRRPDNERQRMHRQNPAGVP